MKIAEELARFTAYAKRQRMDLRSDETRFKSPKTAKAWTKWFGEARAFERQMQQDG